MKMNFFLSIALLFVFNFSCKEHSSAPNSDVIEDQLIEDKTGFAQQTTAICYLFAVKKDSISFQMTKTNDSVNGQLDFNFFEKDGSYGTFRGLMHGDTIRGIYNFESEGTRSQREIAFLKKGSILLMGTNKSELVNQIETIKGKINFESQNRIILDSINCAQK